MKELNNNFDTEIENISKYLEEHRELSLVGEDFIIRPFKDYSEIETEGKTLMHAVAQYARCKYSYGKDFLFALRRKEFPDTPYVTLEFDKSGNLLLAREHYDKRVEDDKAFDFIEQFRRNILLPYIESVSPEEVKNAVFNLKKCDPVYVVAMSWSCDCESGEDVLLVTSSKVKAIKTMNEKIAKEKADSWISSVDENSVGDDEDSEYCEDISETSWSFYLNGYYDSQHTDIRITEVPFEVKVN